MYLSYHHQLGTHRLCKKRDANVSVLICLNLKLYLSNPAPTCWGGKGLLFINLNCFLRSLHLHLLTLIQISTHIYISYLTTSGADILGQIFVIKGNSAKIEVDKTPTMFHICQVFQSYLSMVQISHF